MAIIRIDDASQYDTNRLCGPSKVKNKMAYSIAELRAIAKSLKIKPIPKTSADLCREIQAQLKAKYGVDIIVTVQNGPPPAPPAPLAPPAQPAPLAPPAAAVDFDMAVDCNKKGKGSLYTLEELKIKAKALGIPITKMNKVAICEAIKAKLGGGPQPVAQQPVFAPPQPVAPQPTPSPPKNVISSSPLGYIANSDFVKIKAGLVFNMNVECGAKKTISNPQNYNKKDLEKFAHALGIKLKKTNTESCNAIKEKIRTLYKKPSAVPPSAAALPLQLSPTPTTPLTEEELIAAIRKCLNLKN